MRFTVPFLLAVAVFTATVLWANQTSFNPNDDMIYDIVSASDALSYRLERAFGISNNAGLIVGAFLLTLPALFAFHLFRIGFGGAVHAIVEEKLAAAQRAEEHRLTPNSVVRQREADAKRRARPQPRPRKRKPDLPQTGEVLTGARAGDAARDIGGESSRADDTRRSGIGANLAAAFAGRGSASTQSGTTSSGTTSLSSRDSGASSNSARGLRGGWDSLLDKRADFSTLKNTAADGIRKSLKRTGKAASGVTGLGKNRPDQT